MMTKMTVMATIMVGDGDSDDDFGEYDYYGEDDNNDDVGNEEDNDVDDDAITNDVIARES